MTEQSNKISVRDVIDLYKINKSIDMANKSIYVYIFNGSITFDLFKKYIEHLYHLGKYIFITYIDPYIITNIKLKNIKYEDIIDKIYKLKIDMYNVNKNIYTSLTNIYVYISNLTPDLADFAELYNAIKNIFNLIITIVKNKLITKSFDKFDKFDKSDILHIIDADINFNYKDIDIIKKNLLCEIFLKKIYNLINLYDNTPTFDIQTILTDLNIEIKELDSCKLKLLAIIIRDACINKNITNIIDKFDIIKAINDLNKFKEIDTIYTDDATKHTDYNLKYISYRRTKQYIEYDKKQEINFNIPINYLKYYSNSCYMDVIFFSLLYKNNKFLLKKKFEKYYLLHRPINNELKTLYNKLLIELEKIYNYIHNKNKLEILHVGDSKTKDKLRYILNDIHNIFINNKYYYLISNKKLEELYTVSTDLLIDANSSSQYGIDNFIIILFTIFQLNDIITIEKSDGTYYNDIMLNIPENNMYILPDFFEDNDNNITIVKSNLLVLSNKLNYIQAENKYAKLIPPPYLNLKFNKKLIYLQSIIIHNNLNGNTGHYTCLFNNNSIWYEYDDMNVNTDTPYIPRNIGTLNDIIIDPTYNEYIVMLIYY